MVAAEPLPSSVKVPVRANVQELVLLVSPILIVPSVFAVSMVLVEFTVMFSVLRSNVSPAAKAGTPSGFQFVAVLQVVVAAPPASQV